MATSDVDDHSWFLPFLALTAAIALKHRKYIGKPKTGRQYQNKPIQVDAACMFASLAAACVKMDTSLMQGPPSSAFLKRKEDLTHASYRGAAVISFTSQFTFYVSRPSPSINLMSAE
eukprot:417384-Pelagomonas_calceolata.AAC.2